MLIRFFFLLRTYRVPAALGELLDLLGLLRRGSPRLDAEAFYFLARLALVKDERFYDRFDRAWADFWGGVSSNDFVVEQALEGEPEAQLREWLAREQPLSEAEDREIEALLAEYRAAREAAADRPDSETRHAVQGHGSADGGGGDGQEPGSGEGEGGDGEEGEGGSGEEGSDGEDGRGTGGNSPIGADGESEEGVRDREADRPQQRAREIWAERRYADLDDTVELGTRNFKVALRRLRRMARTDPEEELDLSGTIDGTARQGGILDIQMRPLRRNSVKVLLFLDIGGSMDEHVGRVERLFVAARSEFKYLEEFWFHNCPYEHVWREPERRAHQRLPLYSVLNRYGRDWKVVVVGDAHMNRDELSQPGGSIEHHNEESGATWIKRLVDTFPRLVWINPRAENAWQASLTVPMIRGLLDQQMYPLTNDGLLRAMQQLVR